MKTHLLDTTTLDLAIALLQQQQVVVLPTETVYGLAADASSDLACQAVFRAKCRPPDNPLIVHCADTNMASLYMKQDDEESQCAANAAIAILMAYSPGPVSVIVYATKNICNTARASGTTVALRIPHHPLFIRAIQGVGVPLAAPSANRSGEPSPTDALMAWEAMNTKVPAIVDGGVCAVGLESTIVNCTVSPPQIVRPGLLSAATLSQKSGVQIVESPSLIQRLPAHQEHHSTHTKVQDTQSAIIIPGGTYRHYAPYAAVIPMVNALHAEAYFTDIPHYVYHTETGVFSAIIHELNTSNRYQYKDIAIIVVGDDRVLDRDVLVFACGLYAHKDTWQLLEPALYALFAEIDRLHLKAAFITCPTADEHHALYNRITRASMG